MACAPADPSQLVTSYATHGKAGLDNVDSVGTRAVLFRTGVAALGAAAWTRCRVTPTTKGRLLNLFFELSQVNNLFSQCTLRSHRTYKF